MSQAAFREAASVAARHAAIATANLARLGDQAAGTMEAGTLEAGTLEPIDTKALLHALTETVDGRRHHLVLYAMAEGRELAPVASRQMFLLHRDALLHNAALTSGDPGAAGLEPLLVALQWRARVLEAGFAHAARLAGDPDGSLAILAAAGLQRRTEPPDASRMAAAAHRLEDYANSYRAALDALVRELPAVALLPQIPAIWRPVWLSAPAGPGARIVCDVWLPAPLLPAVLAPEERGNP
jgi:hypothetical protein